MEHSTFTAAPSEDGPLLRPFDPTQLDERSDAELDLMPFGVICLDAAGIVRRYNLAEARLARLDRAQVIGKDFFRVVAPCTATPAFEGKFREIARGENPARLVRFAYRFDFKFGAQDVEIEIIRATSPGRFYLCINRKKFFDEPQPLLTPGLVAPLQRDLAPNEEARGVRRGASSRREVALESSFFSAMQHATQQVAPALSESLQRAWGLRWGRLAVVDQEVSSLERVARGLRERPVKEVLAAFSQTLKAQGWGEASFDFSWARDGAFLVTVERSALAESLGAGTAPRCHLLAGYWQAVFSHLAQRLVTAQEARCQCQGHPRCAFVIASATREAQLSRAIAQGGDLADALRALRGGQHGAS